MDIARDPRGGRATETYGEDQLEPGATKSVSLSVPLSVLAYIGVSGEVVMEPGPVELSVGASSSDIRSIATVDVTGQVRTIKGE